MLLALHRHSRREGSESFDDADETGVSRKRFPRDQIEVPDQALAFGIDQPATLTGMIEQHLVHTDWDTPRLWQLGEFRFCLLEDQKIFVRMAPESQKLPVSCLGR